MTTTVRDLMHRFPPQIITFDDEATVSSKQWVTKYPPFHPRYVIHREPTNAVIERFLGPSKDTPSAADFIGLDAPASLLNHITQVVSREGEVTRDFDQNLGLPLALAFSPDSPDSPTLWSRSLVGRRNETSSMKTIDYQMMMPHSKRKLELAAAAGEMKRLGVIDPLEWNGKAGMSAKTTKLQQELRGYAHMNLCPQVFLFDSLTLVIVQFRASQLDDILNPHCYIDCCVIPRGAGQFHDQCTMQYALYRLAWRGWVRLCATLDYTENEQGEYVRARKSLTIHGYKRKYDYFTGSPYWLDRQGTRYEHHPHGYERRFQQRRFQLSNGHTKREGLWIWSARGQEHFIDTLDCFIQGP